MTPSEQALSDKLTRAQLRREARLANMRDVYAYRYISDNSLTDNLLLLPSATRDGHCTYLESQLSALPDLLDKASGIEIVRIGSFDKSTLTFTRAKITSIINIDDFVQKLKTLKK